MEQLVESQRPQRHDHGEHDHFMCRVIRQKPAIQGGKPVMEIHHDQHGAQNGDRIYRFVADNTLQMDNPSLTEHIVNAYCVDGTGEGVHRQGDHLWEGGGNGSKEHDENTDKQREKLADADVSLLAAAVDQVARQQNGEHSQNDRQRQQR